MKTWTLVIHVIPHKEICVFIHVTQSVIKVRQRRKKKTQQDRTKQETPSVLLHPLYHERDGMRDSTLSASTRADICHDMTHTNSDHSIGSVPPKQPAQDIELNAEFFTLRSNNTCDAVKGDWILEKEQHPKRNTLRGHHYISRMLSLIAFERCLYIDLASQVVIAEKRGKGGGESPRSLFLFLMSDIEYSPLFKPSTPK